MKYIVSCDINSIDRLTRNLIDLILIWGVGASLSYWMVLLMRFPAVYWYPIVALFIFTLIYFFFKKNLLKFKFVNNSWALVLLVICLCSASLNLFTNRPDNDDIAFSHRAVVASENIYAPLSLGDTAHDEKGLPPLTPLHVFTSIEVTTALVAKLLNLPQIFALHLVLGTVTNFFFPIICFIFLRFFRLSPKEAIVGAGIALLFVVMSGNTHRDWGNFTVLRSWQGKTILMELIVPLTIIFSLRFYLYGKLSDFYRIHAVTICGIGLSGTGLFLIPFIVGSSAIAVFIVSNFSIQVFRRCVTAQSICLEIITVILLPWLGILPKIGDLSFYISGGWPTNYIENLGLVFHEHSIPLYILYLSTGILFLRRNKELISFWAYLAVGSIFLVAPISRDLLMNMVTPGAYWRFSYAFFPSIYLSLAIIGLRRRVEFSKFGLGICLYFFIIVIASWYIKSPILINKIISWPDLKFNHVDMHNAIRISEYIPTGAVVFAPYQLIPPLGLLRPDIRFITTRPAETIIAFTNAGNPGEGNFRVEAAKNLFSCNLSWLSENKSKDIWFRRNLVIILPAFCHSNGVISALGLNNEWVEKKVNDFNVLQKSYAEDH